MTVQLYSAQPIRALLQIAGDLLAIAIVVLSIWISQLVREAIASLGVLGTRIEDAGSGFSTSLRDAGEALAQVPLVGEGIAQPFRDASVPADELAAAGVSLRSGVDTLATAVGTALWLLPVLVVLLLWVLPRVRSAVRAGATGRLARSREGRDLLALRALVGQPTARLLAAVPDPVGAFREADAAGLEALAAIELRSAGVRA
ncbi:hypothetical protein [Agrococcus sp. Marseille-P2731]|uniref:hypothetical protein n=1 Tax=Agrococcus sp. Marseille-P2731 TaxID=1841862 RepID=UPI001160C91A|nr:hypothetical protein [Agrococcus sp. Marseille-P2731]